MPRAIIDTESSRPAYIRRNVTIAVLLVVIVALAGWAIVAHQRAGVPVPSPYRNGAAPHPGK